MGNSIRMGLEYKTALLNQIEPLDKIFNILRYNQDVNRDSRKHKIHN